MRTNPAIAVFLTIGIGFWVGQLKYKTFSLGTVTSVLLVGVLVGQLDIPISEPMKSVFFLLFLFAIGYSVGPQFFHALKGSGLRQVGFACVMCVLTLVVTVIIAKILGYNPGEAVGLFAGAQTISAVIGVGDDTISTLGVSAADKKAWMDIIPVCYAVTYVFGTIGSAYILGNLGPKMLGGLDKVRKQTADLERQLNRSAVTSDPAYIDANRPVAFRAYKAEADFFTTPRPVSAIEEYIQKQGRRLFVERVRKNGIITEVTPDLIVSSGDEIVLSGRREYIIGDESWIGSEVADADLLDFPAEVLPVTLTRKAAKGLTVDALRMRPYMRGVAIKSVVRAGVEVPVLAQMQLHPGDCVTLVGLPVEVNAAASHMGYADR
ncbi:MAG: aspartate-alanine antiporter, partial [Muribaculaceae bacterium]|nr:aspartate-alanine antiporter [Muribaculaceae bacterium]